MVRWVTRSAVVVLTAYICSGCPRSHPATVGQPKRTPTKAIPCSLGTYLRFPHSRLLLKRAVGPNPRTAAMTFCFV